MYHREGIKADILEFERKKIIFIFIFNRSVYFLLLFLLFLELLESTENSCVSHL